MFLCKLLLNNSATTPAGLLLVGGVNTHTATGEAVQCQLTLHLALGQVLGARSGAR